MRARSILVPLLLALAGSACSNEVVTKVKAMADRACACTDAACADKVEKDYYDFAKTNAKARGTEDERKQTEEHYSRMRECITKTRSGAEGAAPAEAPAAGQPAAPAGATEAK
jgi:hypothetical protein